MKNATTCLVTGATGYVGTELVKRLYDAGYPVTSLVLPGEDVSFISAYSSIRYADVCDKAALEREAVGFDIVIHLAGIVDISTRNRAKMQRVNVEGTTNVAKLCKNHHMKMIYCSSVHAIPCLPKNAVMTEITAFDPLKVKGLYSKTKAEATKNVLEMTHEGLEVMVAFPAGIIGPNERRLSNIGQLIVDFLCGSLTAYLEGCYNFVDVRDVTDGMIRMIENWSSGECYILSGYVVSAEQMLMEISRASGKKMLRTKLPYWFVLATSYLSEFYYFILRKKPLFTHYSIKTLHSNCNFSNKKARDNLGFLPRPTEESLAEMTRWVMKHFVKKSKGKFVPCGYIAD